MTLCMTRWDRATFGFKLHAECHGCSRAYKVGSPVTSETKQPPLFSDKCPLREEKK